VRQGKLLGSMKVIFHRNYPLVSYNVPSIIFLRIAVKKYPGLLIIMLIRSCTTISVASLFFDNLLYMPTQLLAAYQQGVIMSG
jgi:hypothetical protein